MARARSAQLFYDAKNLIPGGVNSPARAWGSVGGDPLFFRKASGSRIWDVDDNELIVPCSTAYPARLDRETGKLIKFELPAPGRLPGGWYATLDEETSRALRRGKLTFDNVINSELHEDKMRQGEGSPGVSRIIRTGGRPLKFDDGLEGVDDELSLARPGRRCIACVNGASGPEVPAAVHALQPMADGDKRAGSAGLYA